jgi:hypothetical protein
MSSSEGSDRAVGDFRSEAGDHLAIRRSGEVRSPGPESRTYPVVNFGSQAIKDLLEKNGIVEVRDPICN